MKRNFRVLLPMVLVLVFLGCRNDGGGEVASIEGGTAKSESAESLSASVSLDGLEWSVESLTDLGKSLASDNSFIDDVTTEGSLVKVEVSITNEAKEEKFIFDPKLIDDEGRAFGPIDEGYAFTEGFSCVLQTVNPAESIECHFIYDLPGPQEGLKLRVQESAIENPKTKDIKLSKLTVAVATDPPPPTEVPIVGLGDAIDIKGMSYTVTNAENAGTTLAAIGEYTSDKITEGSFIKIFVDVSNDGEEAQQVQQIGLVDADGREFTRLSFFGGDYITEEEDCEYASLNPGFSAACITVFEIPTGASGLEGFFKESEFDEVVVARVALELE